MPLAMAQFKEMAGSSRITDTVLKILPCLMNSMVVKTMQGQLHESIAALEGYVLFYHMLLAFAEAMPEIRQIVDKRIAKFLRNEWGRSKDNVPNLGEFIACLAISDKYTWEDVREAYILESFDRQVKWFKPADLARLSGTSMHPDRRIRLTSSHVLVSNRLCLFNVAFFRLFRAKRSASMTKRFLDSLYGRPTAEMVEALQRDVKRIQSISGMTVFRKFFEGVGLEMPSKKVVAQLLWSAVQNSRRRGYHGPDSKLMRQMARAARFEAPKPSQSALSGLKPVKSSGRQLTRQIRPWEIKSSRPGVTVTRQIAIPVSRAAPRGPVAPNTSFAALLSTERSAARAAPRQAPRLTGPTVRRPVAPANAGGAWESHLLPGLRISSPARAPTINQRRRRYVPGRGQVFL